MNTYIDQLFGLEGKVALVTGATHGIGFGIAVALGKAGATICFNGRSEEKTPRHSRRMPNKACMPMAMFAMSRRKTTWRR